MTEPTSPIVELRQYTLHPGRRDTLVELFDREFVESQEAVGMEIIGQFRDLDDPDRFVWLRGFQDMVGRKESLEAFYGGLVWKKHAAAANATMVDSDDVLLLRVAEPGSGFSSGRRRRPSPGASEAPRAVVVATVYHLEPGTEDGFAAAFRDLRRPAFEAAGAAVLATFVTERSENTFPALPVRENVDVFVVFTRHPDREAYERHASTLAEPGPGCAREPGVLRLAPTARSRI